MRCYTHLMSSFEGALVRTSDVLEPKLQQVLLGEGRLNEAMRYAVLGGGKRFRPFLVLESAKLFDVHQENALNVAVAVELVHCYSLVHDDLPAMDNDDMRRGKPSVHKQFGEATAILAGDALQSLAFEMLAGEKTELTLELARAIGRSGMAGGQQLDLDATADIERVAALKTGALIHFSVLSGAILSGAEPEDRHALDVYAQHLGLAFQLSDDILDAAKDAAAGKRTLVTTLGIPGAKDRLEQEARDGGKALERFGARARTLQDAAAFMARRAA